MVLACPQGPRWEGWLNPSSQQRPLLCHSSPAGLGDSRKGPAIPLCPQVTVHGHARMFCRDMCARPHVLNCTKDIIVKVTHQMLKFWRQASGLAVPMGLLFIHMCVTALHYLPCSPCLWEHVGQTCPGDDVGLCYSRYRLQNNSATHCKSFLHVKHLFAVALLPSRTQNPEDRGGRGIGRTAGSAAVGPSSGRQSHLAEEEEVIKQLELLRADGWRLGACWGARAGPPEHSGLAR